MKNFSKNPVRRFAGRLSPVVAFLVVVSVVFGPAAAVARSQTNKAIKRTPQASSFDLLGPAAVFSNPVAINVPDAPGTASSTITVSGTSGPISSVSLTLNNLSIAQTRDLNMLLVGPGGQKYVFFSDVGGLFSVTTNVTITLSDAAASLLPSAGSLASGTFQPTN